MSLKTAVCRLCLAMDAPMRIIADGPLQSIYEKITNISLNTDHRPVMACYICYSQLRKCHNLMVRAVKADKVLTQMLESGEIINNELLTMKKHEIHLNDLCVLTQLKPIVIAGSGHNAINVHFKEEPQSKEEIDIDRHVDYSEFEDTDAEDIDRVVPSNLEMVEIYYSMTKNENNLQLENVDRVVPRDVETVEIVGLTIKEESTDQLENAVDIEICELTGLEDKKFARSDHEEDIERVNERDVNSIKNKIVSGGDEIEREELEKALKIKIMDASGVAVAEKCKQTHAEKIQDTIQGSTLILGEKDIQEWMKEPYECDMWDDHLKTHLRTNGDNLYRCEICKVNFMQTDDFKIHLRTHMRKDSQECEMCTFKFRSKMDLKKHLRTNTGKNVECAICKVSFRLKSDLKKHFMKHTDEQPYECEICDVTFTQKSTLKTHLITHMGKKPYQCVKCKVKFTRQIDLKTHLVTHTKEKPYECEMCKIKFVRKGHLEAHLITHTRTKPFQCKICKIIFTRSKNLKAHHLLKHTASKPYENLILIL